MSTRPEIIQLATDAANGDEQAAHYLRRVCMAEASTDLIDRSTWQERYEQYIDYARQQAQ